MRAAPFLLAATASFTLFAHAIYFVRPPSKTAWLVGVPLLTVALIRVAKVYLRVVPLSATAAGLGLVAAVWWGGDDVLSDGLWKLPPAWWPVAGVLLGIAHAGVAIAMVAGLIRLTRLACPTPAWPIDGVPWKAPLAIAILAALLAHIYVSYESTVYVWDYWMYWARAGDLAMLMRVDPLAAMAQIRHATHAEDYGPFPITLPAAVMALLGPSRGVYVPTVAALTFGATALAAGWTVRRLGGGRVAPLLAALLVLTSPLAWAPVLRGYPDLGGVALGLVTLGACLGHASGRLTWRAALVAGVSLGLAALYRRWFSFFAVAFFVSAGLDMLIATVRQRSWRPFGGLTAVGVWALLTVVIGSPGWVVRAATTDYASAYTAYHSQQTFGNRLAITLDLAGPVGGVVVLIALAFGLTDPRIRRATLIIAGTLPVILLLFLRVQDFGPHHCYLLLPAYLALPVIAFGQRLSVTPRWLTAAVLSTLTLVGGLTMTALVGPPHWRARLRPAVADFDVEPLRRGDLAELRRLLHAVDAAGGTATAAASSFQLTSCVLVSANASLGEDLLDPRRVTLAEEVDRVSAFPAKLLRANVVVVGTPMQTHLRPAEQQGIIQFAAALAGGTGVGAAYERLPGDYHLEGGVTATIYRRTRPITAEELAHFAEGLRQAHPDEPKFYTPPAGFTGN